MASALIRGGRLTPISDVDGFSGSALIFFDGGISWATPRVPDRFLFGTQSSTGSGLIRGLGSALIVRGLGSGLINGDWWEGQRD